MSNKIKQTASGLIAKLRTYNNLLLLSVATFTVTIAILGVSLFLYRISGTAQLDLSRPGYENARDSSEPNKTDEFSSSGPINDKTIETFNRMFDARAQKVKDMDAFRPEALDNSTLNIVD